MRLPRCLTCCSVLVLLLLGLLALVVFVGFPAALDYLSRLAASG